MPNGFTNPYLTTSYTDPVDVTAQYYDWPEGGGDFGPEQTYTGQIGLPSYEYQGMGTDIMSALSNVFAPMQGSFTPQAFSEDLIQQQLLQEMEASGIDISQIGGLLWEGPGLGNIEWDMDLGEVPSAESALAYANVFDPESLSATLSQLAGLEVGSEAAIRPGEVIALTPEMIEKTTQAYYEPYETSEREGLVEKKTKAVTGAQTGGFAGSGARAGALSGAEKLYKGGYGDILADIMKMRGGATEGVLDTIYGWQELMSGV